MRGFFKFLTIFDWISPATGLINESVHPFSWTFEINIDEMAEAGWDELTIRIKLNQHGIPVYGVVLMPFGNIMKFSVPNEHYGEALWIMQEAGIPVK